MVTLNDIAVYEERRKTVRKQTYIDIYTQFSKKIHHHAKMGETSVRLHVPPFVIGHPPYNVQDAVRYLTRQLENGGFRVVSNGNDLHVCWTNQRTHCRPKKRLSEFTDPQFHTTPAQPLAFIKGIAKRYD